MPGNVVRALDGVLKMSNHSTGHKTDHKTDYSKQGSEYRSAASIPLPTQRAEPGKVSPEETRFQSGKQMKGNGNGQSR
jgi:hypothetical protein